MTDESKNWYDHVESSPWKNHIGLYRIVDKQGNVWMESSSISEIYSARREGDRVFEASSMELIKWSEVEDNVRPPRPVYTNETLVARTGARSTKNEYI